MGKTEYLEKLLVELASFAEYDSLRGGFTAYRAVPIRKLKVGDTVGHLACGTTYRHISLRNAKYLIHRLVWLWHHGKWPTNDTDHINQDKTDNRIENLRDVPRALSMRNSSRQVNNTSGIVGVCFNYRRQRWTAYARVRGQQRFLGNYLTKEEAAQARQAYINNHPELGYTSLHGLTR